VDSAALTSGEDEDGGQTAFRARAWLEGESKGENVEFSVAMLPDEPATLPKGSFREG
jgi:hypothetical protein